MHYWALPGLFVVRDIPVGFSCQSERMKFSTEEVDGPIRVKKLFLSRQFVQSGR